MRHSKIRIPSKNENRGTEGKDKKVKLLIGTLRGKLLTSTPIKDAEGYIMQDFPNGTMPFSLTFNKLNILFLDQNYWKRQYATAKIKWKNKTCAQLPNTQLTHFKGLVTNLKIYPYS